ncbi:MAG: phosphate signaling complex protein PhoU [Planctomycetota bacterium]|jgi:phosphate transport system protein
MTKHFMRDLGQLADRLVLIGNRCENAFGQAIDSLLSRDPVAASDVVQGDSVIDEMEVELEEEALKILALHAPVAGDLRFLIAAIKINNDLERIADIASNIAKRTIDLEKLTPTAPPDRFEEMAQQTRTMVRETIQALVRRDEDHARRVMAMDDVVDDLNRELLGRIERRMCEEPESVPALMRWGNVVRLVERIADYATNIAEDIIYMEEGDIVRHGEV